MTGLSVIDIMPNPVEDNFSIIVNSNIEPIQNIEIYLIDALGVTIKVGNVENLLPGENLLNVTLPNISQGSYYLLLKSGEFHAGKLIQIIK